MAELEIDPRPAQVQIMYLIYNQFFPSSLYDKMKGETSDIYISLMCIHGIYIYIYMALPMLIHGKSKDAQCRRQQTH